MSTTSKFNPISLAIRKKLRCRLGLTTKRYLSPAQKPIDDSDRNCEWSVPTAASSTLDPGQDVRNDVFFIKIQKSNQGICNLEKQHNSTSQQGDLFERQINENRRLNIELLQRLSIALGHSSIHITEHYVAMSKSARSRTVLLGPVHLKNLQASFIRLRPSEVFGEDAL